MSDEEANIRARTREGRLRALEEGLIAAGWTPLEAAAEVKPCDACTRPSTSLHKYAGDAICEVCEALFTAANALFDNGITDEVEIIGTLAFAYYAPDSTLEAANKYFRFEVVRVVDGVPVLRLRRVAANVLYYEGSRIVRAVNVEVFSRHADPGEVSVLYEQTLAEHGIHYDKCSGGSIKWSTNDGYLTITVNPEQELHPSRVSYVKEYPRGRIYSFAPPSLIRRVYPGLLGSADPRTLVGYAYGLGDHGRHKTMTAEKTILGCVAWLLGEGDSSQKPRVRRPRTARVLNRHLLQPLGKTTLPEDGWSPDDTIWRDADKVSKRLMRAGLLLQRSVTEGFGNTSPKTPV
jgi:hypothetical protein